MNIRQARDLALKILGLYYLSSTLPSLASIPATLFAYRNTPELAGQALPLVLSILLPFAFWLAAGLLLAFRTDRVSAALWPRPDPPETATGEKPSLRFWIVLVGFFFSVKAAGGAVAQVYLVTADPDLRGSFIFYRFLPDLVTLVLGIACILGAKKIENWLNAALGEGSRQGRRGGADNHAQEGPGPG